MLKPQTLAVVCALISLTGLVLSNAVSVGLCAQDQYRCREIFNNLGDPVLYGSGALAIVFFALALYPAALRAWKVFTVWYLPIATFFFLFSRNPGSGDFITPYPEQIYQWLAGIYVLLGLLVVIANGLLKRRSKEGETSGQLIGNRYLQILWYAYLAFLIFSAAQFLLSD